MEERICRYPNCGYPILSKGLCTGHYQQAHKGRELTPIVRDAYVPKTCRVRVCGRPQHAKGLCSRHASISARFSISSRDMESIYDAGCANEGCQATDNLHIDHDHSCCPGNESCGKCVRGVLCGSCNVTLGWIEKIQKRGSKTRGLERYLSSNPRLPLTEYDAVYRTPRRQS